VNRIGVDIGGTHTDIVVMLDDGQVLLHKVPSTNEAPAEAVHNGLRDLGIALDGTEVFAHGTTVATNAVIQRTGARTGLLTTSGFRDVLQIRRTTRGELYDFQWDPPAEIVPRRWRLEVDERTAADGEVLQEVDLDAAVDAARRLRDEGVESLAIAFINSYRNPANEEACLARIADELPDLPVYASADLLPAWREFERTSTAVVGAYVGPVLTTYLRRLAEALAGAGYRYELMVMRSNGGLATAESAIANPVSTLMSGPAAGVIAQVAIAGAAGITDLIGMDVGGTSTDVSVVLGGATQMRAEYDIEFGTVVGFPMIDIHSIGAGGGTVAWLDEGNMLHAGPRSAGAQPGPACYVRGGTEPTITDAHVVTGRLNPEGLLGGGMAISADAAAHVIGDLGARCGLALEEMAAGIITLAVSNIAAATRQITVERGVNPRELALVAYGGGGPTLACDVARELEVPIVLVPPNPGLTSATGLLLTDIRHDFVRTYLRTDDECSADEVAEAFAALIAEGDAALEREGIDPARRAFELSADLRYAGQTHELTVGLGDAYTETTHRELSERLRVEHLAQYGHAPEGPQRVELVSLRVAAFGRMARPEFAPPSDAPAPQPVAKRRLFAGGGWHDAPVYRRSDLGAGASLAGPAIVEQLDTTTVLLPGWTATVDDIGSLLLHDEGTR
jgi:N-methylhydantoinase A